MCKSVLEYVKNCVLHTKAEIVKALMVLDALCEWSISEVGNVPADVCL